MFLHPSIFDGSIENSLALYFFIVDLGIQLVFDFNAPG